MYTTNYDEIIEGAYKRRMRSIKVYSTNFDFTMKDSPDETEYFKLHGTISKDVSLGDRSRIIITEADYDVTDQYRDQLFDRLKADIGESHLIIIGHSLADEDIRTVVNRALSLRARSGLQGRISLLMYSRDEGRASLWEARGVEIVFGSLDDFFAGLVGKIDVAPTADVSGDPLDSLIALRPSTIDAAHALATQPSNVSAMYNGWPATFGDISAGIAFRRLMADDIVDAFAKSTTHIAIMLGPSGVGKTTAARQVLKSLVDSGFHAWQHSEDQVFLPDKWREMALKLTSQSLNGVLLVDDAHTELPKINELVDGLHRDGSTSLRLVLVSTNHNWGPRLKSPPLFKIAKTFNLNKVAGSEIDRLLDSVDRNNTLRVLVESEFAGYNRAERRRRLTQRCEADMFVCLKNIFSSDKLDDIILREYATLENTLQDIYKSVAAMESAGVHVHRQLVIRLLGLPADQVSSVLARLEDIIHEKAVDTRTGIYSWRGRHQVIMKIIAEHKYYEKNKRYDLFERIIDNIRPTYDIEIRTIRDLCNVESGLATIVNLKDQNFLLRKMISVAPGERVPRHRLIRNLIEMGHFDAAETEIKTFRSDFRIDAPTTRYRIKLATARAVRSKGLMQEDRIALIGKAEAIAVEAAKRYKSQKSVLGAYCEVGIEIAKLTGKFETFDSAISLLKKAEEDIGDADISKMVARFERRMSAIHVEPTEHEVDEVIEE
ncbi:SIR2 family protein [Methylobacterium sp. SD274]|uniref:SIR2 family protein n=1 Tax=Methylobacterium sp. SD274 TaxID=2782009 RepID=UPI001A9595C0